MNRLRKMTAILLAVVIIALMIPMGVISVNATSNMTLRQLQAKFPAGYYWNHIGSSSNNPDGYTSTPCNHHGSCDYYGACGCNSAGNSIQCFGFANKLAYDAYGSYYTSWSRTSLNNLKAGDVIRYKNDRHSIFVTGVDGDTIIYGDCNSDGHCKIRWDATISKSTVASSLTAAYSAPSELTIGDDPIIQHWYDDYSPVDLGNEFYAQIKNKYTGRLFTKEENDVNGRHPNGDKTQLWRFTKLDDDSYVIRSAENDWCLDVEAGNNIDNLNNQPSGTNVQVYGTYNGTGNQRYYIYNIFGAYYFRPVGMEKVVDLGVDSNLVAVWDYAENFAPQKFDIIKQDFNGYSPENIGENFYAYIRNTRRNQVLSLGNSISSNAVDVYGTDNSNLSSQIWHFMRLSDGSYRISNLDNNWYLDVEAGNNINNISEQPDGTNIQAYSTYNGTDNQRFYIYRMFNSYYIKPVGTSRFVDMGVDNGLVALWGYGEDFDPQKFDIVRVSVDGYLPADIGQNFYAYIKNIKTQYYLTEKEQITANVNNVSGIPADGTESQIWHFIKNADSSYTIQNVASKMYLDVDAGDCINNLSALPDGTNVTTYYKYNDTNNQKFFIYRMFDSYYIKPVGINRVLDLALSTGEVAVWNYARDFDPQKFDIIELDYENRIIGDTDLDGHITISDATAIQCYLAELTEFTDEQLAVADTNGDGEINISDATHLQMFLAEFDGIVLGKS